MKYSKSWTEVLQEVKSKSQKEDASNDKSDDGEGLDKVDPKAVKKKFKDRKDKDIDNDGDTDSTDKYLHKRRKAISKAVSADEQVGVRKVDFVDGVTPNLDEKMFSGKGEFEVKYASSKKGPIKVSKFNTLEDAKKFLAQVKKEGMNGIISKGGKPVKEDEDLEKVAKELEKASKMHLGQSKRVQKHLDKMDKMKQEEVEIDEKKSDYEDQIKAYLAKGGKIQKGDKPDQKKIDKVTKSFMKKLGIMKKKEAELDAKDKEELEKMMGEESINEAPEKFVVVDVSDDSPTFQRVHAIYDTEKQARASIKKSLKDLKKAYGHDYIALQIVKTSKKQKVNTSYKGDIYADSELGEASDDVKKRLGMFKRIRDKKASQGFQKTGLKNVESVEEHCGECGAMDHVDEKFKKGKYTVRDGNTGKVIATYSSGEKASKEMHKLMDTGKYTDLEVKMEEVEIDEKMDGRKKFSGKQAKKDNEDRRDAMRKRLGILGPNEEVEIEESDKAMMMKLTTKAMKAMPNSPKQKELIKQVNVYRKKLGMKPMKEETINEADYELYHKTFSAAMQHAYAHAKKKGFTVDPNEIDNKVATGPKKPSKGKTNRYILGTDKKKNLHVQVANLDDKRFELNMYIEEVTFEGVDTDEALSLAQRKAKGRQMRILSKKASTQKRKELNKKKSMPLDVALKKGQKQARKMVMQKVVGKGKDLAGMSPQEKEKVEVKTDKRIKSMGAKYKTLAKKFAKQIIKKHNQAKASAGKKE